MSLLDSIKSPLPGELEQEQRACLRHDRRRVTHEKTDRAHLVHLKHKLQMTSLLDNVLARVHMGVASLTECCRSSSPNHFETVTWPVEVWRDRCHESPDNHVVVHREAR